MTAQGKLLSLQSAANWDSLGEGSVLEAVRGGARFPNDATRARTFTADPIRVRFEDLPDVPDELGFSFRVRASFLLTVNVLIGFWKAGVLQSFTLAAVTIDEEFQEITYSVPDLTLAGLTNGRQYETSIQLQSAPAGIVFEVSDIGMDYTNSVFATYLNVQVISRFLSAVRVTKQITNVVGKVGSAVRLTKQVTSAILKVTAVEEVVVPRELSSFSEDVFIHNWVDGFTCDSSWRTSIRSAITGDEERLSLFERPSKLLTVRFTGLSDTRVAEISMFMEGSTEEGTSLPFYPHRTKINSVSGNQLFGDFQYKRFFKGQRVAVVTPKFADPGYTFRYFASIVEVSDTSLTLDTSPSSFSSAYVFPMLDVKPTLEASASIISGNTLDYIATFTQQLGDSALPGLPAKNYPTFRGFPIFEFQPDWAGRSDLVIRKAGSTSPSGRDTVLYVLETDPQVGFSLDYVGTDLGAIYELIQFFDFVKGRREAFYLVSPSNLGTVQSISSSTIVLTLSKSFSQNLDSVLADKIENIGVIHDAGTSLFQVNASLSGSTLTFTTSDSFTGFTPDSIKRISVSRLSRLDSDSMTEEWLTNGVMTTRLGFIQLVSDQDVVL